MHAVNDVVWWLNDDEIVCTTIQCIRIETKSVILTPTYSLENYGGKISGTDLFSSLGELLRAHNIPPKPINEAS
jgi:hypothetical protein